MKSKLPMFFTESGRKVSIFVSVQFLPAVEERRKKSNNRFPLFYYKGNFPVFFEWTMVHTISELLNLFRMFFAVHALILMQLKDENDILQLQQTEFQRTLAIIILSSNVNRWPVSTVNCRG